MSADTTSPLSEESGMKGEGGSSCASATSVVFYINAHTRLVRKIDKPYFRS